MKRKKICIVATVPFALICYMKPHIAMLALKYDVTLIVKGEANSLAQLTGDRVNCIFIDVARKISIWRDLLALVALYRIFKKNQFDAVHSLMPKTALLAMIASFFAGVPVRIHTFTGQIWVCKRRFSRCFFKVIDKIVVLFATHILTDSHSQRRFLISENIVVEDKIFVLGHGSVCGVNTERFKPNTEARSAVRDMLSIPTEAIVFLFLGRLNRDKGLVELALAFNQIVSDIPNAWLLVVGPDEGGMEDLIKTVLVENTSRLRRIGYTEHPERYMASADIFCLPSHREGFGSVVIEAASCCVPSVASNIYGLQDAVLDGNTGILFTMGEVGELAEALRCLASDRAVREKMAKNGLKRAHLLFAEEVVVSEMSKFYQKVLGSIPDSSISTKAL